MSFEDSLFGGRSRRVDFAAGDASKKQGRRELLEESRQLRAQRQREKERNDASLKIQSFWRGCVARRQNRQRLRTEWDTGLTSLKKEDIPAFLSNAQFPVFVRQFIHFNSSFTRDGDPSPLAKSDAARCLNLSRFVQAAIKTPTPANNYLGLALSDDPHQRLVWLTQSKRLCAAWMLQLETRPQSNEIVPLPTLLLWQFLDIEKWPFVKSLDDSTKDGVRRLQFALAQHLLGFGSGLFTYIRNALLNLLPLPETPTAEMATNPVKTTVGVLFAIVSRVLQLSLLEDAKFASGSDSVAVSTSSTSSLSSSPSDSSSFPSPKRLRVDTPSHDPFFDLMTAIYSIPLLSERLQAYQLSALLPKITSPDIWRQGLSSLLLHLNAEHSRCDLPGHRACFVLSTAGTAQRYNVPTSEPESKAVTSLTGVSACCVRLPWESAVPFSAQSYSWFDAHLSLVSPVVSPKAASASAAVSSSAQNSTVRRDVFFSASPQPATSAIDDEKHPAPAAPPTRAAAAFADDDSDDDEAPSVEEVKTATAPKFGPSSVSAWLLGNLLRVGSSQLAVGPDYALYLRSLREIISRMSQSDFPSSRGPSLHPLYVEQLSLFHTKEFLDRISHALLAENSTLAEVPSICSLLDSFVFSWSTSSNNVLNTLVFSTPIIPRLWAALTNSTLLDDLQRDLRADAVPLLSLFCRCYSHHLLAQDDEDFYVIQSPFSLDTVAKMVRVLKGLLFQLYWLKYDEVERDRSRQLEKLRARISTVFRQLRDRQSRKPFCIAGEFLMPQIPRQVFDQEVQARMPTERTRAILTDIPFVLSFEERVKIFYRFVAEDRAAASEDQGGGNPFLGLPGQGMHIQIHRSRVLEDGYDALRNAGDNLKERVRVTFLDDQGGAEAGIDGGGLFKEFMTLLLRQALDPEYGLFRETDDHMAYPNPEAVYMDDFRSVRLPYYEFIGKLVGKALYDGVIMEPQFANFFLRKLLGEINYLDDLHTLDPEFHRSLLFVKKYTGDFDALNINFTATLHMPALGRTEAIDLIPGGSGTPVTKENRLRFIFKMADWKLNRQIKQQSDAFIRGIKSVVKLEWFKMFAADELSKLISGEPRIDLSDLMRHTVYSNGYSESHEVIRWFWRFIKEMSNEEQAKFLQFVTSCSRAPLLGFGVLNPKLCIQRTNGDDLPLPTASTCMNLLRLPRYTSEQQLREKLKYAMEDSSGFQLS